MKKTIYKKGYLIKVVSWENDADNYRTIEYSIDSIEVGKNIADMCLRLFTSSNNRRGGIGNLMEDEGEKAKTIILKFLEENKNIFAHQSTMTDDIKVDTVMDWNFKLMGGSEYYYSRIAESVEIYYIKEDIEIELIDF